MGMTTLHALIPCEECMVRDTLDELTIDIANRANTIRLEGNVVVKTTSDEIETSSGTKYYGHVYFFKKKIV